MRELLHQFISTNLREPFPVIVMFVGGCLLSAISGADPMRFGLITIPPMIVESASTAFLAGSIPVDVISVAWMLAIEILIL